MGNSYNREAMVEIFGEKIVVMLEMENCGYTNRVMDACDEIVEFSAALTTNDLEGNICTITAYYYQHDPIEVENLDDLEWEVDDYGIDIIKYSEVTKGIGYNSQIVVGG